jgi:hypothetical protein
MAFSVARSSPEIEELLGNLAVTQLVKKYPDISGSRRFDMVFTRVRYLTLSRAR